MCLGRQDVKFSFNISNKHEEILVIVEGNLFVINVGYDQENKLNSA